MERESESFTEDEEAKEDRPDAADRGDKEDAPPDALRVQSDRGDDSQGDEQGPIPHIADHESEEERRRDKQEQRRVKLVVTRRRVQVNEEFERPRRLRIPQEHGRRLAFVSLLGFARLHIDPEPLQACLQRFETRRGHPSIDDERVVAHRESERRFRLVDFDLERLLGRDDEGSIALSHLLESTLDLLEPGFPLVSIGNRGIEEGLRAAFASGYVQLGEARPTQERKGLLGRRPRHECRDDVWAPENLRHRHRLFEAGDVALDPPDDDRQGLVTSVRLQGQADRSERTELLDPSFEVSQQPLRFLAGRILFGDVELKAQDFLPKLLDPDSFLLLRWRLDCKDAGDRPELDEVVRQFRGWRERLSDSKRVVLAMVIDDVDQLEFMKDLDTLWQFVPRPRDNGPAHAFGPKHESHLGTCPTRDPPPDRRSLSPARSFEQRLLGRRRGAFRVRTQSVPRRR